MARELTPEMDLLLLCQPSAWCDAVSGRYPMLEMQNRLCAVPRQVRYPPRLRLPADAAQRAGLLRKAHRRPAVFIAPGAYTMRFGDGADAYCREVARCCVQQGVHVYWNGAEPGITHELCTAVGGAPLAEAVALATLSDAVISMRSGFSDLVGFVATDLPHLVFYPEGNYPDSALTWLEWCSLRDMGVSGAVERVSTFETGARVEAEFDETREWLQKEVGQSWRGIS